MIEHDVLGDGVPGNLAGRMLIVGVPSDQMVNQSPAREYATAAGVEYFTVESDCGHIGTTCEMDSVAAKVHAFLDQ